MNILEKSNAINWEIVTGCTRVSSGCDNCPAYWEHMVAGEDYTATVNDDKLLDPISNTNPSLYVVAFGSDLFHWKVPSDFIIKAFQVMNKAHWHTFEVVTKRAQRLAVFKDKVVWGDNIAIGVAVESGEYKERIDRLRGIPSRNRFVSMCPIVGPMGELDLSGISLVGVVEETWGTMRKADPAWIEEVERQANEQNVAFSKEYYLYNNREAFNEKQVK